MLRGLAIPSGSPPALKKKGGRPLLASQSRPLFFLKNNTRRVLFLSPLSTFNYCIIGRQARKVLRLDKNCGGGPASSAVLCFFLKTIPVGSYFYPRCTFNFYCPSTIFGALAQVCGNKKLPKKKYSGNKDKNRGREGGVSWGYIWLFDISVLIRRAEIP